MLFGLLGIEVAPASGYLLISTDCRNKDRETGSGKELAGSGKPVARFPQYGKERGEENASKAWGGIRAGAQTWTA
jgi:hypothetical protein